MRQADPIRQALRQLDEVHQSQLLTEKKMSKLEQAHQTLVTETSTTINSMEHRLTEMQEFLDVTLASLRKMTRIHHAPTSDNDDG
jgi:hypothetical protein